MKFPVSTGALALAAAALSFSPALCIEQSARKVETEPGSNWILVGFPDEYGAYRHYWCHVADCVNNREIYNRAPLYVIDPRATKKLENQANPAIPGGVGTIEVYKTMFAPFNIYLQFKGDAKWAKLSRNNDSSFIKWNGNFIEPYFAGSTHLPAATVLVMDSPDKAVASERPGPYDKLLMGYSCKEEAMKNYYQGEASAINGFFLPPEFEIELTSWHTSQETPHLTRHAGYAAAKQRAAASGDTGPLLADFVGPRRQDFRAFILRYLGDWPPSRLQNDWFSVFESNFLPCRMGLAGLIQDFDRDWTDNMLDSGKRSGFTLYWRTFFNEELSTYLDEYKKWSEELKKEPGKRDWSAPKSWALAMHRTCAAMNKRAPSERTKTCLEKFSGDGASVDTPSAAKIQDAAKEAVRGMDD